MSRLDALHALAWTLPDVLPAPKGASSGAVRGEAPDAWQLCGTCDGGAHTERVNPCPECGGAGRFRVDSMTGRRVGSSESLAPPPTRRVRCDRCHGGGLVPGRYVGVTGLARCPSCDGSGMVDAPLARDDRADATVRFRVGGLVDDGDWDRLLAALERVSRTERTVFWSCRVMGLPVDEAQGFAVDAAVLRALGPARLRVPGWAFAAFKDRHRRAELAEATRRARVFGKPGRAGKRARVRELLAMGHTAAEAARLVGCSLRTAQRAAA